MALALNGSDGRVIGAMHASPVRDIGPDMIRSVLRGTEGLHGISHARALVAHLGRTLGVRWVMIAEVDEIR